MMPGPAAVTGLGLTQRLTIVRPKRTIVRIMRTKKKEAIEWLFPQVRKRVLSLLLMSPEERWYLRDIARRTGCALGTVRRELAGLAACGIAHCVKDGNRTYYQANPACPLLPELTGLIRKTAGLADVVRSALKPLAGKVELAFIYGSQAGGKTTSASDVDLLIVGDMDEIVIHRAIGKAERELSRAVNYTLLSRKEFARRRKAKAGFLGRVLRGRKIAIVGNIDEV